MAIVFAAGFTSLGAYLPFFPLLLVERGLVASEIGMVMAVPMILRVALATTIGRVADLAPDRKPVLVAAAVAAFAGFALFGLAGSFVAILAVMALTAAPWNAITPISDVMALSLARRGLGDYGVMRVWGSIAFLCTTIGAGLIVARLGNGATYWVLLAAFAAQAAAAFLAPSIRHQDAGAADDTRPRGGRMRDLLADRGLILLLAAVALVNGSHAMLYAFGSLTWTAQGFGQGEIGVFWAIGVLTEITLFLKGTALTRRFGPTGLVLIGAAAAVVRFVASAFATTALAWLVLQSLHALSFAAVHLGTMQSIARRVPDHMGGAAQGLYVTTSGLALATFTLISGPLYTQAGARGFLVMAGIAAVGFALAASAPVASQPQRSGSGG